MSNEDNQEKQVNPEEEIEDLNQKEAAALIASRLTRTEMIQVACALDEDEEDEFYDAFQEETRKVAPEIFSGEESEDSDESSEEEEDLTGSDDDEDEEETED